MLYNFHLSLDLWFSYVLHISSFEPLEVPELMKQKRKWEEDKVKVEILKASRRFRPY